MECLISNSSNTHRQKMHIVLLPVFLSPLSKKWLISFASLELPSLCDSTAGSGSVLGPGISPLSHQVKHDCDYQLHGSWAHCRRTLGNWHLEDQIPPQKTGLDHQLVPFLAPHFDTISLVPPVVACEEGMHACIWWPVQYFSLWDTVTWLRHGTSQRRLELIELCNSIPCDKVRGGQA